MGNDPLDGAAGNPEDLSGLGNVQVVGFTHTLNVGCKNHEKLLSRKVRIT